MSARFQFTEDEWQLLIDTPALVGAAVMVCSRSGSVGTLKEAYALTRELLKAPPDLKDNPLIQAVIEHRTSGGDGSHEWRGRYDGADASEVQTEMLARCREVDSLLKTVNQDDALDYKRWIHDVGIRVANASSEGGFMGFGGERVSEQEDRLLEAIASALRL